jgi:hypothetical protein|tara:strand:- start:5526 stop:6407 length:882 start_codon:yes stop_codon:yes gene_type:complete
MKPSELVTWRGTPGVGDFMWALNSCHKYAADHNIRKINLEFHWEHGEDHLHHFEDPETIIERCNYIHNFYHQQERVQIHHVFNAQGRYREWKFEDDVVLETNGERRIVAIKKPKARFYFQSGYYDDGQGKGVPDNDWIFRKSACQDYDSNRIVFWRPTWNAEKPRTWKRLFDNSDWDTLITHFEDQGFDMHEVSYRTPVSEAMYLISTSRMVICYDGIWHYIAKNFATPMAVISGEGVTKYHTPNAIQLNPDERMRDGIDVWRWIDDIEHLLQETKRKSVEYEDRMRTYYGND